MLPLGFQALLLSFRIDPPSRMGNFTKLTKTKSIQELRSSTKFSVVTQLAKADTSIRFQITPTGTKIEWFATCFYPLDSRFISALQKKSQKNYINVMHARVHTVKPIVPATMTHLSLSLSPPIKDSRLARTNEARAHAHTENPPAVSCIVTQPRDAAREEKKKHTHAASSQAPCVCIRRV